SISCGRRSAPAPSASTTSSGASPSRRRPSSVVSSGKSRPAFPSGWPARSASSASPSSPPPSKSATRADRLGLEERPGFAGALRTLAGLEERPGFAGAPRTLGGLGGHFGAPPLQRLGGHFAAPPTKGRHPPHPPTILGV